MSQKDYDIANGSGAAVRSDLNAVLGAIQSNNSGASAPAAADSAAYQWWADTDEAGPVASTGVMKIRDTSTDTLWHTLFALDGSSLPSFSATELCFNEAGADLDFRIEGDTNANLFFVDAGNDRVGIGTNAPANDLDVLKTASGSTTTARIGSTAASGANNATLILNSGGTGDATLRFDYESSTNRASIGVSTSDQKLTFSTAGSTAATIDSSGNLGVGPASPSYNIHGTGYLGLGTQASAGAGAGVNLIPSSTLTNWFVGANYVTSGAFEIIPSTAGGGSTFTTPRVTITSAGFTKFSSSGTLASTSGSYHEFNTATTNASICQFFHRSTSTPFGLIVKFTDAAPDNETQYFHNCVDSTNIVRFKIFSSGDFLTADGGTVNSDATLKRDITDVTPKLADVMQLRVRNFYWKEDFHPGQQDKKFIGFIAQEFEEVFPGLVSEYAIKESEPILDEDGNDTGEKTPEVFKKAVKEAKLVPILVKALQEAVERIETLETKVAALESA